MTTKFGISAIIPTHNRATILRRTLESLAEVCIPDGCEFEVIVVGNRCTDDTSDVVKTMGCGGRLRIHFFEEPKIGANFARNTGFANASHDIIALLDDDLWVDANWYRGIKAVYDSTDASIVGGPAVLWWEAVEKPEWFSEDMEWILSGVHLGDDVKEVPAGMGLIGCNLTVRREVFGKVGLFNTGIDRRGSSLMGGFESDFMQKASLVGYRCFYTPAASVKHWVAPHRVKDEYMLGICRGYGEARVYIKPTFALRDVVRSFGGHLFLIVNHAIRKRFVRTTQNKIRHKIACAIGCGGLFAAFNRVMGKSPNKPL